jgi:tetratricopeptide (TPR) repeat protein
MQPLMADPQEQHFLSLLDALLRTCLAPRRAGPPPLPGSPAANGAGHPLAALGKITPAEAERLLQMLSGLGRYPAAYPLLQTLAQALPENQAVQEVHREAVLAQAKHLADRCDWAGAEQLLAPVLSAGGRSPTQVAALNLLGCCSCMLQDYDRAVSCFSSALIGSGNDPWLHQNLALTQELAGRLDLADRHWNRYFDLLDKRTPVPRLPDYLETLAFESFTRLADLYTKKERWQAALGYLQRAQRCRPDDVDTLERLFHLYNQAKRAEDARKILRRLRELKPNEPQFDLYELDVRETRTLEDIDRMLTDIRRILTRYPNDMRVEERAVGMVANLLPMISRMLDQYTEQFNKTANQVRRLPSYQVNWPAVHDVARDLLGEFQRLRRIVGKCQTLVGSEEQKRQLRELSEQIDRRTEACQSLGG